MLTKNTCKLITSLKQKKYRQQYGLFVVEGVKTIREFLQSDFELDQLYTTSDLGVENQVIVTEKDLQKVSFYKNNETALALFKIKVQDTVNAQGIVLAIDNVRDPGNLGTIIRLCDWFGIGNLICNTQTVDCYNPKVVQATMGSLTRVKIHYTDLSSYLQVTDLPIYGTFMEGANLYQAECYPKNAIIVMGNEANGISKEIEELVSQKITIPRFGEKQQAESLNVATATAITLSEVFRSSLLKS